MLGEPKPTNHKVQEFLKKPPDISLNTIEAEIHLFKLLKEKTKENSQKSPQINHGDQRLNARG
jgi:hypothetical protein